MSKSDDTIFQKHGNSLKDSIVFYSEVDISDISIPRRDEKIISLMIKRRQTEANEYDKINYHQRKRDVENKMEMLKRAENERRRIEKLSRKRQLEKNKLAETLRNREKELVEKSDQLRQYIDDKDEAKNKYLLTIQSQRGMERETFQRIQEEKRNKVLMNKQLLTNQTEIHAEKKRFELEMRLKTSRKRYEKIYQEKKNLYKRNSEAYQEKKDNALKVKEDLDKGSELWNLKLLEISKYKVSKAEKITKAKQEKFLELQRIKQKEKEKNILHNISQNELLEEYERQRNLNAINAKLKKIERIENEKSWFQKKQRNMAEMMAVIRSDIRESCNWL